MWAPDSLGTGPPTAGGWLSGGCVLRVTVWSVPGTSSSEEPSDQEGSADEDEAAQDEPSPVDTRTSRPARSAREGDSIEAVEARSDLTSERSGDAHQVENPGALRDRPARAVLPVRIDGSVTCARPSADTVLSPRARGGGVGVP